MRRFGFLYFIFICIDLNAQIDINITPQPVELEIRKGYFILTPNTTIILEGSGLENSASFFNDYLEKRFGYKLKIGKIKKSGNSIVLNFEKLNYPLKGAHTITINKNEVYIAGDNEAGVFYGIQSIIQLLPPKNADSKKISIPQLSIKDHPRFDYRGMHLDVGRHFFPVDLIKKYIDYLALHKFNYFHWHLTEDQGWRIEIKKYPKLTEVGGCRAQTLSGRYGSDQYDGKEYCGFYSQEEIKDIVKYASGRYITIIPEIDMPGHSLSALASYPFLGCTKGPYKVMETWGVQPDVYCAGNDSTYIFLQGVLDEVMQLFPSGYIHIGGDESPKERWKVCPVCQQKIKDEKLKNEHELQSYFINRIEKYLNAKGRKIIGWDEILEGGLAPNATVMSWRGEAGGIAAAKQDHYVIMTPENPLYINHLQSRNEDSITQGGYNPIENVYNYEPIPKELDGQQAKYIWGAQGNVWTEYIKNERKLEYMIFPRMTALSEVLWSPKQKRNWPDFEKRLPGIMERYKAMGMNYSNAHYDLQPAVIPGAKGGIAWKLETRNEAGKIIYVRDSTTNASYNYTVPITVNATGLYGAALTNNSNKIISNWVWQHFYLNKATGKKVSLLTGPNKSYSAGGAFALVDGVQNDKGMLKSSQFLGFNGKNMEATIDLDSIQEINEITVHAFEQPGSWIYRPLAVSFYTSDDGKNYTPFEMPVTTRGKKNLLYKVNKPIKARYIRVIAKNYGIIPSGEPGAGNNAWLFVDEIEIK